MGKKALLTQLLVSRFEALAFSDYHERLWHLSGTPNESIDIEEAKRWMRKSEDFAIDIAKTKQSIFETLGTIRTSYPSTAEIEKLSEQVFHFQSPAISGPPSTADRTVLENWKQKVVVDLLQLVKREYADPIDALLECMRRHINDPVAF